MSANTVIQVTAGNTIYASDINQWYMALTADFLPRHTDGVPTASSGRLGSPTVPFSTAYFGGCVGTGVASLAGVSSGGDGRFLGELSGKQTVSAVSGTIASPTQLTASQSGYCFTNEGVSEKAVVQLPTAASGIKVLIVVQSAFGFRVKANTGDTIRFGSDVSATAGYIESSTVGATVKIISINATEWVCFSPMEAWDLV